MFPSVNEQMDVIKRGVVDLLPEDELVKKIERSLKTNTPLIAKLGSIRAALICIWGIRSCCGNCGNFRI